MKLRWFALASLLLLAGCADFHERDDAVYIGEPDDPQYDSIPESDWMKQCLAQQKEHPGQICVEGVEIRAVPFEPVTVVGEKGDQYRFTVYWGWHGGRSGWVKKSDIAFPEDFKPVQHWAAPRHWELCPSYSDCMYFDIADDGSYQTRFESACGLKDATGQCPNYCIFTQQYHSASCTDTGQVMEYGRIYQLRNKGGMVNYLIPVEGQGLCWAEAWENDQKCYGAIK